jgi:aryl-alcohol dehydrogenase-like predicted oxidoreductase
LGAAEPRRSRHPGLNLLLTKLHRQERLTDEEAAELRRQIDDLEAHARREREDGAGGEPPPAPAPAAGSELRGAATGDGTERFVRRRGRDTVSFYCSAQGLMLSSVGMGTFRGGADDGTDAAYLDAIEAAFERGVNLVDTSLNYRHQRSERSVGAALRRFVDEGGARDEVVVCTKGGYVVRGAFTPDTLGRGDVVGGMHSLARAFLADQLERSRRNLGLETIDVYYLHNPETQLEFVEMPEFLRRIRVAFELLEEAVAAGSIRYYGTATWHGYRDGPLSLTELAGIAREVAGDHHHFRFVQLPFNLGMPEALMPRAEDGASVLEVAAQLGITVIASAALLQARLTRHLPAEVVNLMPGLDSDAPRAIQFTRSTPGIACALVGTCDPGHVAENLAVAGVPPLARGEYDRLRAVLL